MNACIDIRRRLTCLLLGTFVLGLLTTATPSAVAITTGNLLTDPGFESNPLLANYADIFNSPFTQNVWGAEAATISGNNSGVSPINTRMLRMTDDGASYTQAWQKIDVSPYAAAINAGNATVNASALYNVPSNVAAGIAATNVNFYDSAHNGLAPFSVSSGSAVMDTLTNTWQPVSVSAPVPVGTQYLVIQAAFLNSSMVNSGGQSRPGFVDEASLTLTLVPEPSSLALLAAGIACAAACHRRLRRA